MNNPNNANKQNVRITSNNNNLNNNTNNDMQANNYHMPPPPPCSGFNEFTRASNCYSNDNTLLILLLVMFIAPNIFDFGGGCGGGFNFTSILLIFLLMPSFSGCGGRFSWGI